jgi:hypothetical protein
VTSALVGARTGEEAVVRMSDLRRQAIARHHNAPLKGNAVWPF